MRIRTFQDWMREADYSTNDIDSRTKEIHGDMALVEDMVNDIELYIQDNITGLIVDADTEYGLDLPEDYNWFDDESDENVEEAYESWDDYTTSIRLHELESKKVDEVLGLLSEIKDKLNKG